MSRNLKFKVFSSPGAGTVVNSIPPGSAPMTSTSITAVHMVNRAVDVKVLALMFTFVVNGIPVIRGCFPLLVADSRVAYLVYVILYITSMFTSLIKVGSGGRVVGWVLNYRWFCCLGSMV